MPRLSKIGAACLAAFGFGNGGAVSSSYSLAKSLRLRSASSSNLSKTYTNTRADASQQIKTYSVWIKRGSLNSQQTIFSNYTDGNNFWQIYFDANNCLNAFSFQGGLLYAQLVTAQPFRDSSAWYHISVVADMTQATASNRFKFYVNGVQITSFSTATYPPQNSGGIGTLAPTSGTWTGQIGNISSYSYYFDGYLSEINVIDGQALAPSNFGESDTVTGVWKPKKYTGTYGSNGYYLPFTDVATTSGSNSGLGKDLSGNGNYWNTNNISVASGISYDSVKDVPTLTDVNTANYAVLNPLDPKYGTLYDGNTYHQQSAGDYASARSTLGMKGGKWYWEVKCLSTLGSGVYMAVGIGDDKDFSGYNYTGSTANGYTYDGRGFKVTNNTTPAYAASYTINDIVGVAFDADNGTLEFFKNGVSQGVAFTGINTSLTYYATHWVYVSGCVYNFGQQPFTYAPPTGFKSLNTYNLPDSAIPAGNKVMDIAIFTGDGTSPRSFTNAAGFKPDLIWQKSRSNTYFNTLFDSVRGFGDTKALYSNSQVAEGTYMFGYVSSANSNGYSVTAGTSGNQYSNESGATYVGWQWQAGQGINTTNTSGSITSTVSANPSAGFSIVTYSGSSANATVGHGLGVAPQMIFVKGRTFGADWICYTAPTSQNNCLFLDAIDVSTASTAWNNTTPTSSVFSLGSAYQVNRTGDNYVAYCWAPVNGFSKFDYYTGNGSTDGPFIYTGFRPRYILFKGISISGNWVVIDTARSPTNTTYNWIYPNLSDAEASTSAYIDILSNGFKIRNTGTYVNGSGSTYFYAAFAENPFKNALAR